MRGSEGAPRRGGTAISYDGTRIAYRVYGPDRAPRTLVLSNGLGCSEVYWRDLVRVFADDHRIVTWDYRGHGATEEARDGLSGIDAAARDLDAVVGTAGAVSAVHAGFSMGVAVILEKLRRAPDGIEAFVAIQGPYGNPLHSVPGLTGRSGGRRMGRLLSALRPTSPATAPPVMRFVRSAAAYRAAIALGIITRDCPRPLLDEAMRHATAIRPKTFLCTAEALFRFDAEDVLATIHVPTLILAGTHDILCPLPVARRMQREIPGATLEVLPSISHAGPLERGTEIGVAIRRFLRSVGAPARPGPPPPSPPA